MSGSTEGASMSMWCNRCPASIQGVTVAEALAWNDSHERTCPGGDPSTPCTLGQSGFDHIPWPGPIVSYSWGPHVLPAVLRTDLGIRPLPDAIDAALADDNLGPLSRALMADIRREATPNRLDLLGLGDVSLTEPGEPKPFTTAVIAEYADALRNRTRPDPYIR